MDTAVTLIQLLLGLAAIPALIRVISGPTLADRIIALDLILFLLAGGVAVHGARRGEEVFIAIVITVALVAFAGTVLVARFIEWRDVP